MYGRMKEHLEDQLARIEGDGLYKRERVIAGPQQAMVEVAGRRVLNMCANNYLGLAGHPEIIEAADLVTEMRQVKHPYHDQGILAQRGIEF